MSPSDLLMVPDFICVHDATILASVGIRPDVGRHDRQARLVYGHDVTGPLVNRVSELLAEHFEITKPLYCDYCAATKSTQGMGHARHADAVTASGQPNHTSWRVVTAMLYLNDYDLDFTGGQLHFPDLDITVDPKAGLLVGFRCDVVHEVPPVLTGTRRAMAFWFTHDEHWKGRE